VSSNASVVPAAVTPTEAIALLDRMREASGHRFLVDDVPLVVGPHLAAERVATYRQVTDAHLLALARRHGARLATIDRGIATMAGGEDLVLVPVA
jgi:predicted nucleic acid-binding protein